MKLGNVRYFFLLALLLATPRLMADQVSDTVEDLRQQLAIIESVKPFVQLSQLPTLFVLRSNSSQALESILDKKRGPLS